MAEASQGTYISIGTGNTTAVEDCSAAPGFPTIITKVAHGLKAGDVVTFSGATGDDAGMLNTKKGVVKNVLADSFAVNIDTTGAASLGSAIVATPTEWQEIGEVIDMDRAAGERTEIDTTHLRSTAKEFLLGLKESGTYTFSLNWLFDDDGQDEVLEAEGSDDSFLFRVSYPSGNTMTFEGLVKSVTGPSLGVDNKLSGSVNIKITGEVTFA